MAAPPYRLLQTIWDRGTHVYYNRARAYLRAAFSYGLGSEYDPARKSDKVFGLTHNPADALPRHPKVETARERALSEIELRTFYQWMSDVDGIGPLLCAFLRFCLAASHPSHSTSRLRRSRSGPSSRSQG